MLERRQLAFVEPPNHIDIYVPRHTETQNPLRAYFQYPNQVIRP